MSGPSESGLPDDLEVSARIGRLVRGQPYGVLCTQRDSEPYGSLVALAVTEDLAQFVFSTPTATRKYESLSRWNQVALVIDSRSESPAGLMGLEAVTALGRAHVVPPGADFARLAGLLVGRHPQLAGFVEADTSALIRIEVARYVYVRRFEDVRHWVPPRDPASDA
jgi:hypothetical protein